MALPLLPRQPSRSKTKPPVSRRSSMPQAPAPAPAAAPRVAPRPPARGWAGRGGGGAGYVQAPAMWRSTTVQACGLWPWSAGTGSPMVGVPIGRNIDTNAPVCADPISWFQRANLISNPSAFVLGKPGLGKSTMVRRWCAGLTGYGTLPLVLGDLKPDYVDLIRALGGQVIELGRGRGYLNVLDPGEARATAARLTGSAAAKVTADAHGRRHQMVASLISIARKAPPTDREESILDRALRVLDDRAAPGQVPVLADLLQVLREAPEDVRAVALDRGDIDRYRDITEHLEATLIGLTGNGRLGEMFSKPTTTPMRRDAPVVFDVSSIDEADTDLSAAALLACWSYGFGAVNNANVLADAGLEPRRHYFVVLDELWRALRASRGLVERVDALTRLNRQRGVGLAMITHTMSDLDALPDADDRMKARGFVERAGMVVAAGLPEAEMAKLAGVVHLSRTEQAKLVSWTDPPVWDPVEEEEKAPPGQGNFLVKVGGRTGIPVHVDLTPAELALNDTNKLWHAVSRAGRVDDLIEAEGVRDLVDEGVADAPVNVAAHDDGPPAPADAPSGDDLTGTAP